MTIEHPSAGQLLRTYGLRPKRDFGQNFLVDERICEQIAEAAITSPDVTALEIGAGLGSLTYRLLQRGCRLIAVERDRDLVPVLRDRWPDQPSLSLLEDDAARLDWLAALQAHGQPPYVVVGNLPYAITGKLLLRAVELAGQVDRVVFMVQREVGDRLCAEVGTKEYSTLTVFTRAAYSVKRIMKVSRGAFLPPPKVDSSVILLEPLVPPRAVETAEFREVVKRAFSARRKTLRNSWRGLGGWSRQQLEERAMAAEIDLDLRAERLEVEDFDRMAGQLSRACPYVGP